MTTSGTNPTDFELFWLSAADAIAAETVRIVKVFLETGSSGGAQDATAEVARILAAEQHLQPAVGQQFAELPQPLPWILIEEAYAGVERGASPAFDRPVACLVEIRASGNHVFHCHARRHQALVGIAQDEFGYIDYLRHS